MKACLKCIDAVLASAALLALMLGAPLFLFSLAAS